MDGLIRAPLEQRVRASPERIALIDATTGTKWTYEELDNTVEHLAAKLAGLGVNAGDHLGMLLDASVATVRLVHAGLRLGALIVPLNVRLAPSELERHVAHADLDWLVCDDASASAVQQADVRLVTIDVQEPGKDGTSLERAPSASGEAVRWRWDDSQLMLFTSGTTGEPRLVELTAGNLQASAFASAMRLGVRSDDRWLLCLPIYHMGGLAPVFRTALYGTALVVHQGFDPASVAAAARGNAATGISLVPMMLERLFETEETLGSDLRFVLLGGAPAEPELIEECEARDVPVYPTYGMTETASQITTATPEEAFTHRGTVGRPLLGTEVSIVGPDGISQPDGEMGEVVVSSPTVMRGYYDDPEATEATFGRHGFHTGDVGRLEDGRLWVVGRLDDRIVTGGETVDPEQVATVLRSHSLVEDATVVGVNDPDWGERVAAVVVGDEVTAEQLEAHCREHLAGFKCPRQLRFVSSLPRTPSGTIDRDAVLDLLAD